MTITTRTTVFDAIGGAPAIQVAVDNLYDRLRADVQLSHYFDGVDMRQLKNHMRMFLAAALGGPNLYQGRNMRLAHAHLGITAAAWDTTVGHLVATLADLGVAVDVIAQIGASVAPLRDEIVSVP